ncbi:MAG: glycosyltransferase family 4 protein [Chthonomonadales bacterium]
MSAAAEFLVIHVMRPAQGGIRRHVQMLCPRLAAMGARSLVAAPPGHTNLEVPAIAVPIRGGLSPADILAAGIVARSSREAHLVHGHGLRGAWIAYLASSIAHKPLAVTLHNVMPPAMPLPARWALTRIFRHARAIISVSRAVEASLQSQGFAACRMELIPNGIDLAEFEAQASELSLFRAQLHLPGEAHLVASAGRLSPEKGFHILMQAARILEDLHPNAYFAIAGSGPEESALRAMAPPHVRFLGYLPRVAVLLLCADLVAIPSLTEGHGLVALEAMAARRPVVASNVGGLTDTILHGDTGLLVPAADAASLAQAIGRLLGDEELRSRMGEAGRARVEAFYTADLMAARTFQLYRHILNAGAP